MMSFLSLFASEGNGIHVSLRAERVFTLGPLHITNSMIYGVITSLFIGWVLITLAKKSSIKPKKGPVAILEMVVEFVIGMPESLS